MGNDGLVISDIAPIGKGKCTWLKILANGSKEWYEPQNDSWQLIKTEIAPAEVSHSHSELGDINFTGSVSAGGDAGLTGSKVLDGKRLTFTNGILTGFEVV